MSAQGGCAFEGCVKPIRRNGLCSGHSEQRRLGKELTPLRRRVDGAAAARFDAYAERRGECLIWTGPVCEWGYGVISVDGRADLAHRWSYRQSVGPVGRGTVVDHMCHERLCVRPDHLQAVSYKQNNENRRGAQSNSKSGIRGVCHVPGRGWLAQGGPRGAGSFAGYHPTAEAAGVAARAHRNRRMTNNLVDRRAAS